METQEDKARRFQALHEAAGAFVIPNPWDVGSARLLEELGFQALATTSSGLAGTLGKTDGEATLEETLAHLELLSRRTSLPINADMENGFADDPQAAARNIALAARSGVAGASIEDWDGRGIYDFELALARVSAAVEAVRALELPFVLTARAENLLHGVLDLEDTIRRLQAFEQAGADVLYAPGLTSLDQVRAVTRAIARPLNVLAPMIPGATVAELADAGAKRISVGGALARAAAAALRSAAAKMLDSGSFEGCPGFRPA